MRIIHIIRSITIVEIFIAILLYNDLYIFSYFHGPGKHYNSLFYGHFCSIFAVYPCYRTYFFHNIFMTYLYCHIYLYKNVPLTFVFPVCMCTCYLFSVFFFLFPCFSWLVVADVANSSLSKMT